MSEPPPPPAPPDPAPSGSADQPLPDAGDAGDAADAADAGAGYAGASPFRHRSQRPLVQRTFPIVEHLPDYPRHNLRRDLTAGVTVGALAVPSAMAYAELAGLPPIHGLYAVLFAAVGYALLGSSRQVIVGPEGALAVLVASALAAVGVDDPAAAVALASMLALLVAAAFGLARLLRLGWVADYFSRSVLVGYIHGVAVVLIVGQLGKLFGLDVDATDPLPQLAELFREVAETDGSTVAVGIASIAVLLVLRWQAPRVPSALLVVIAGIGVSAAFDLEDRGVAVVGDIPPGLPSITWPGVDLGDLSVLVPAALGIFAVCYADGILTARSFAGRRRQHVDADQELVALGAANLTAGLGQGFPVGASGSRTAVNAQMGGRTQVVGLLAAGLVAVVLVFLTAPVEVLPKACLGAVIVVAAIGLIDPDAWRELRQAGRGQVVIAGVAGAGVVVLGVLPALIVAVALSILDTVARSAKPHDAVLGWVERLGRYANVTLHPSASVTPGVVVYRLDDRLFFANAGYFTARAAEAVAGAPTPARWLMLDAEGISQVDASGVQALQNLHASLRHDGIGLAVARLKDPVRQRFDTTGLTAAIGADNFHPTVRAAVAACVDRPATSATPGPRGDRR
jgi:high affinity sulfate transporter 1